MPANIKKIAQECGLPLTTVASALLHPPVSDEERKKVLAAAEACGYSPEGIGRINHNLGVLFAEESNTGITHPFFASMLNAFKNEADAHGYDVTFLNHGVGDEEIPYLDHCRYRSLDGVFMPVLDFQSPEVRELLSSSLPCVTVDHPFPGQPAVMSDNRQGMRLLVDYAASLGHRHIAFIHGQRNSLVTESRIEEFLAAMEDRGLPVPGGCLVESSYDDLDLIRVHVRQIVERPDRPTCLLLPDDACYLAAQEVIRECELRIPADVSVAGFDGIPLTQSLRPHLTTIRQHNDEMGRAAAQRLIQKIEHPEEATDEITTIPVTLLKGETVGWCGSW